MRYRTHIRSKAFRQKFVMTMVAGVSIFMVHTIESSITRALSSGFSVGASLNGENLFDVSVAIWDDPQSLSDGTGDMLPHRK